MIIQRQTLLLEVFFSLLGSRQSAFSADARSLDADLLLRKCVFSRLEEVNEEEIFNAIANETSAFIVLVPNLRFPSKANKEVTLFFSSVGTAMISAAKKQTNQIKTLESTSGLC